MAIKTVERFQGFNIKFEEGGGYFWENGGDGGGYFETLAECRDDIARYNRDEMEQARREGLVPHDSPALDAPWWAFA